MYGGFVTQKETARALSFLSRDEYTGVELGKNGGMERVMETLTTLQECLSSELPDSLSRPATLMRIILQVFSNLAKFDENREIIAKNKEWIKELTKWAKLEDPYIGLHISQLVYNLSQTTNPQVMTELLENGFIILVNELSENSSSIAFTKANAISCLIDLAKNESNHSSVISSGGIETLRHLVVADRSDIKIQALVSDAIVLFAKNEKSMEEIVNRGWLEIFYVWAKSDDKKLRLNTANALEQMIQNDKIASKIIKEFGFGFLLGLADMVDIDIQLSIERMLKQLKNKGLSENNESEVVLEGGINVEEGILITETWDFVET